jgi:hypothetical protein
VANETRHLLALGEQQLALGEQQKLEEWLHNTNNALALSFHNKRSLPLSCVFLRYALHMYEIRLFQLISYVIQEGLVRIVEIEHFGAGTGWAFATILWRFLALSDRHTCVDTSCCNVLLFHMYHVVGRLASIISIQLCSL